MLPSPSTVRRSLRRGVPYPRPRREENHRTRRVATIGATAGLAVGAAAGALPFILRGTPAATDETEPE